MLKDRRLGQTPVLQLPCCETLDKMDCLNLYIFPIVGELLAGLSLIEKLPGFSLLGDTSTYKCCFYVWIWEVWSWLLFLFLWYPWKTFCSSGEWADLFCSPSLKKVIFCLTNLWKHQAKFYSRCTIQNSCRVTLSYGSVTESSILPKPFDLLSCNKSISVCPNV